MNWIERIIHPFLGETKQKPNKKLVYFLLNDFWINAINIINNNHNTSMIIIAYFSIFYQLKYHGFTDTNSFNSDYI